MRITAGTLVLALFMAMAGCAVTDDPEGDCLRFVQWTGACAGQGRPCSVTLTDSNLAVSSTWQLRSHCTPN
jgi:hypothetical protein